jgi:TPR repeat protein
MRKPLRAEMSRNNIDIGGSLSFHRTLVTGFIALLWFWGGVPACANEVPRSETPQSTLERADTLAKGWKLKEAVAVLEPLADGNDPVAQFDLGRIYDADGTFFKIKGKGGQLGDPRADFEKAKSLYEKSASQGYVRAQGYLGKLYIWGVGAMRTEGVDNDKGMDLLHGAAEQGDAEAQCSLGLNYYQGIGGVAQDLKQAMKWFRLAAEQGDELAAGTLGYMYAQGEGTTIDLTEAYVWFSIAGEPTGNVAKQMTMEQVDEASRRVEALKTGHKRP